MRLTKKQIEQYFQLFDSDIEAFALFFCKSAVTDDVPDFHREIYSILPKEDRVVIAAPRGFAKSTLISKIYPLWLALFKKRNDVCIISASESLAAEHLRYIKQEIESNPLIIAFFGDLKSEKWTESHIIIQHADGTRVSLRAKGAGGQIRGFRPDCIILDDIETDDSVESEEQRGKLKSWLFKACINTLLPRGQLLLIGTIIHPLSVLADLLDTPNGWYKRKYKAYRDGIEETGYELWSSARPHEWLQQRKREIGSWAFAAEFMNDPKSDESAPIKEKHLRYWEDLPKQLSMAIAIDPAYSEDEKADYKVAALIGIDQEYNRYLIDYVRTHAPSGDFIDQAFNLYQRYSSYINTFGVPNSGTEKEFYKSVTNKALERRLGVPITPLSNTFRAGNSTAVRNKKKRIVAALQPWFERGKYYIHHTHIEAREELLTIGSSRWDDLTDAMAYAEQILQPTFYEQEVHSRLSHVPTSSIAGGYGLEY